MAKRDCFWSDKVLRAVIRHCVSRKARLEIDKAVRSQPDWGRCKAQSWEITPAFPSVIFDTTTNLLTVTIDEWSITLRPSGTRCHIDDLLEKLRKENKIMYGKIQIPVTIVVFPYFDQDRGYVCLTQEVNSLMRQNPLRNATTIEP